MHRNIDEPTAGDMEKRVCAGDRFAATGDGGRRGFAIRVRGATGERGICALALACGAKAGWFCSTGRKDLRKWEYLHPLVEGTIPADSDRSKSATDPVGSGEMWECPDFFAIRDKFVLIYSTQGKVFWQSGALDTSTMKFKAEKAGLLDHGSFYAPKTQLDAGWQSHPVGMAAGDASAGGVSRLWMGRDDEPAADA